MRNVIMKCLVVKIYQVFCKVGANINAKELVQLVFKFSFAFLVHANLLLLF